MWHWLPGSKMKYFTPALSRSIANQGSNPPPLLRISVFFSWNLWWKVKSIQKDHLWNESCNSWCWVFLSTANQALAPPHSVLSSIVWITWESKSSWYNIKKIPEAKIGPKFLLMPLDKMPDLAQATLRPVSTLGGLTSLPSPIVQIWWQTNNFERYINIHSLWGHNEQRRWIICKICIPLFEIYLHPGLRINTLVTRS